MKRLRERERDERQLATTYHVMLVQTRVRRGVDDCNAQDNTWRQTSDHKVKPGIVFRLERRAHIVCGCPYPELVWFCAYALHTCQIPIVEIATKHDVIVKSKHAVGRITIPRHSYSCMHLENSIPGLAARSFAQQP